MATDARKVTPGTLFDDQVFPKSVETQHAGPATLTISVPSADKAIVLNSTFESYTGWLFVVQVAPPLVETPNCHELNAAIILLPSADEASEYQDSLGAPVGVQVWANAKSVTITEATSSRTLTAFIILLLILPPKQMIPNPFLLADSRRRGGFLPKSASAAVLEHKTPPENSSGAGFENGGRKSAVVADGLNRAAFLGFLAARFLVRRGGLLVNIGVAAVLVALEIVRRRLAAQVAVNALVVHVVFSGGVFGVFVCCVSHKLF